MKSDDAWRARLDKIAAHSPPETRYSVLGEIARGGMGRVLRVWDEDLRRMLAMKVVGAEHVDPDEVEEVAARFLEEAQVTAQLDHPGIVPVHEIGIDAEERIYFTMPLVKGRTLAEILPLARQEKEEWSRTRAVGTLRTVCETVAFAHEKGVVHRDLKPSNVMVGRFGEVYVMDWGLAKVLGRARRDASVPGETVEVPAWTERSSSPRSDGVVGSPAYMPPEQAAGEEEVGPLADVYALGAILYELLSGHMPYGDPRSSARGGGVLERIVQHEPTPLLELDAGLPGELVAIAEKAMERDPRQRYPSVLDMAGDLRRYLEGRVVPVYESGTLASLRKWAKRNPRVAALLTAVLLMLASWAVYNDVMVDRIVDAKERVQRASYRANLHVADLSLLGGDVAEAKRSLDACDEELRGWEWRHLALEADSSLHALAGHRDDVNGVAFSPDDLRGATACDDGSLRVWDLATGKALLEIEGDDQPAHAIAWSPDGERLAAGYSDGSVRLWSASTGEGLAGLSGHRDGVTTLAFSPDGSLLATGSHDTTIILWSADTLTKARVLRDHPAGITALAFSPDGSRLVSADAAAGELRLWDPRTGSTLAVVHAGNMRAMAFDPRGTRIATGSPGGRIQLWNAHTLDPGIELAGHEEQVTGLAFTPDGARLVSCSVDKTISVWAVSTGKRLSRRLGHEGEIRCLAIDSSGERLLTGAADRTARLWDLSDGGLATLRGHSGWVEAVDFDRLGAAVASGSRDHSVLIWDLAMRGLVRGLRAPEMVECVAFDPTRNRLASGSADHIVRIWNLDAEEERPLELRGHTQPVTHLRYDDLGLRLLSRAADGTVRIWNAENGDPLLVREGFDPLMESADLDPHGARFATGSQDGFLRIWNADTGALLQEIRAHEREITSLVFDTSGDLVLTGSRDDTARVYDLSSGKVHELRGHDDWVTSVAFLPDGSRVVTASKDGTVRVWSLELSESLLTLRGSSEWMTSVAVSPDGRSIAAGSRDQSVRVWSAAIQ